MLTLLAQGGFIPKPPEVTIVDLGKLISGLVGVAMIVASLAVFAYLIWGGFEWITSGGDKTAIEGARNKITAALVGLTIVASAWAVMLLIEKFFGLNIFGETTRIPRGY